MICRSYGAGEFLYRCIYKYASPDGLNTGRRRAIFVEPTPKRFSSSVRSGIFRPFANQTAPWLPPRFKSLVLPNLRQVLEIATTPGSPSVCPLILPFHPRLPNQHHFLPGGGGGAVRRPSQSAAFPVSVTPFRISTDSNTAERS